ncbi:hypothetical protein HDE_12122 [Halotydeus destructor]|nr:hypothetical protein HDE_12122 [Halotydeus destructor]
MRQQQDQKNGDKRIYKDYSKGCSEGQVGSGWWSSPCRVRNGGQRWPTGESVALALSDLVTEYGLKPLHASLNRAVHALTQDQAYGGVGRPGWTAVASAHMVQCQMDSLGCLIRGSFLDRDDLDSLRRCADLVCHCMARALEGNGPQNK